MKIEEPDLAGTYSYSDYVTWTWDEMVELIRGRIYKMSPAPSSLHQRISVEFLRQISNFLIKRKCEVFSAPFDVRLPSGKTKSDKDIFTVVQPDLCIICDPAKIDNRGCLGAPDWIVEILSKNTSSKDLNEKFDVYEEAGVKEYWVVHPEEQTVLVFLLDEHGKYQGQRKTYSRTNLISPQTLPGLTIDLIMVFPE